jgi:hypothetical protein
MKFVIFVSTFIKFVIGMMSPAFPRIQGGIYGNRSSRQGFIGESILLLPPSRREEGYVRDFWSSENSL